MSRLIPNVGAQAQEGRQETTDAGHVVTTEDVQGTGTGPRTSSARETSEDARTSPDAPESSKGTGSERVVKGTRAKDLRS